MQFSVIAHSDLDNVVFRLDAEYYHPEIVQLEQLLKAKATVSIRAAALQIDCSAFYPSVVPYYRFDGNGIPFLRVNEIQGGLLSITENTVFLPETILEDNRSTIAKCFPNDIIIAKGGNSLGKVALLTDQYPVYAICRDVIVLKTSSLSHLNRHYLWMYLHSKIGQKMMLRTASQTGQPHLTVEAIYELKVPLFSTQFMKSFEVLFYESIASKTKAERKFKQSQKLLLKELGLSNWKSKHKPNFVKRYSDVKQAKRMDAEFFEPKYDEILSHIKATGQSVALATLLSKIQRGKQPSYAETGLSVINSKHVANGEARVDANNRLASKGSRDITIQYGDVLINGTGVGTIGRCAPYLRHDEALPDNHVTILRPCEESIDPVYLSVFLNSIAGQSQVEQWFRGSSGQIELYPDDIARFTIWQAPDAIQATIRSHVENAFKAKADAAHLLECAKRAVEMAIEKNEEIAIGWLKVQTQEVIAKL